MKEPMLKIPDGHFDAYLFDCDGTIADSMPLHHRAWHMTLTEWNCPYSDDLMRSWAGIPTPKTVELLNQRYGLSMPVDIVVKRREDRYLDLLSELKPIPEVLFHIELQYKRIPMAVVSGSSRNVVEKTLTALELINHFNTIITAEDCLRGKPDPEPFLLAAKKLKVLPQNCIVFEDADLGIQAAEAAGMRWVRIPDSK